MLFNWKIHKAIGSLLQIYEKDQEAITVIVLVFWGNYQKIIIQLQKGITDYIYISKD
jgi:hypothetical protein